MKVLFITVGGSPEPVITSITQNRPDFVCFLATSSDGGEAGSHVLIDGTHDVKQVDSVKSAGSIPEQTGLSAEQYCVLTVTKDDPFQVYQVCIKEISRYLSQNDRVIVDYTGGTKSMSAGLALAGSEYPECDFSIVTGKRTDLIKVKDGMARSTKLRSSNFHYQRQMRLCKTLVSEQNYNAAHQVLSNLSANHPTEGDEQFDRLYYLTKAFDEWDKFNYEAAGNYLRLYKEEQLIKPYNSLAQRLAKTINWFKSKEGFPPPPGFLLVYDLLANAERKAAHRLYDDAVSRMYRAVELYEQFCLMTHDRKIVTSDVDLTSIPDQFKEIYESKRNETGKIQLGLKEGYELLERLNHPVGTVWQENASKIVDVLKLRNNSFLAHGIEPVTEESFIKMKQTVWPFIESCDEANGFSKGLKDYVQLPKEL